MTFDLVPAPGRTAPVLIDHLSYGQSVILHGGPVPWEDRTAYASFFGKTQDLLRPDATLLDLGRLYAFLVDSGRAPLTAMAARGRPGYALKVLLGDARSTETVAELVQAVAHSSRSPLVLRIPSPAAWLAATHPLGGRGELTDDDAERASLYLADWLRGLSSLPVSMILLDGRGGDHSAIANVTHHYRWSLAGLEEGRLTVPSSGQVGAVVPDLYWTDSGAELPAGDFYFADIPAGAVPEVVLTRLAGLS